MTRRLLPVILAAGLAAVNIGAAIAGDASPQDSAAEQFIQQSEDNYNAAANDKETNAANAKKAADDARDLVLIYEICNSLAGAIQNIPKTDMNKPLPDNMGYYATACAMMGIIVSDADKFKQGFQSAVNDYLAKAKAAGEQPKPIGKDELLKATAEFKAAVMKEVNKELYNN